MQNQTYIFLVLHYSVKMANQQKVNLGRLLYKRLCHEMKSTVTPKVTLYLNF